jgi:hypothetical protein
MGIHSVQHLAPIARMESATGPPAGGSTIQGAENGYQVPPEEIRAIVDAPPTPSLSFSPTKKHMIYLQRRSLPPLSDIARPELKLAGIRIDPEYNMRSRGHQNTQGS